MLSTGTAAGSSTISLGYGLADSYEITADEEGNIKINGKTILTRDQSIKDLTDPLALKIDSYTKVISGLVSAVSRGKGNDKTAEWAQEKGDWYNEAVEGIWVYHYSGSTSIGLANNDGRGGSTFTMDPNVSPKSTGTSDKFKKGTLVQFRSVAAGNGAAADSNDIVVTISGIERMFISRPFLVSSNVQELD